MVSKKKTVVAAFGIVTVAVLILGLQIQGDQAYGGGEAIKLDGTWILRSTDPARPIQAFETLIPMGSSGRRAAVQVHTLNADPTVTLPPPWPALCPEADYLSVAMGQAVMTGPTTAEATFVAYAMDKKDPPQRDEIECIWVFLGTSEFTSPNRQEAVTTGMIYPASADADGDMLPDPDQQPMLSIEFPVVGERVPMMLLYEP